MPHPKTVEELREVAALLKRGASYEEFPAGVTWADLDAAEKLDKGADSNAG